MIKKVQFSSVWNGKKKNNINFFCLQFGFGFVIISIHIHIFTFHQTISFHEKLGSYHHLISKVSKEICFLLWLSSFFLSCHIYTKITIRFLFIRSQQSLRSLDSECINPSLPLRDSREQEIVVMFLLTIVCNSN